MVSTCAVTPLVRTSDISSCQNNFFGFLVAVNSCIKVKSFGFLAVNICNHGEHYETPCISQYFNKQQ
jgi:hypothetical protein